MPKPFIRNLKESAATLVVIITLFTITACSQSKEEMIDTTDYIGITKTLFTQKYPTTKGNIHDIQVIHKAPTHMRGEIQFNTKTGITNANYLATKTENKWKLVFDGNRSISCNQMRPFEFPQEMIADCQ
jgi:hypothetical protein